MMSVLEEPKVIRDAVDLITLMWDMERVRHCFWSNEVSLSKVDDDGTLCLSFLDNATMKTVEVDFSADRINSFLKLEVERPFTKLHNYFMSQLYNALNDMEIE